MSRKSGLKKRSGKLFFVCVWGGAILQRWVISIDQRASRNRDALGQSKKVYEFTVLKGGTSCVLYVVQSA